MLFSNFLCMGLLCLLVTMHKSRCLYTAFIRECLSFTLWGFKKAFKILILHKDAFLYLEKKLNFGRDKKAATCLR